MRGIVSRVEQVRAIIGETAVASRQQSAGVAQVGLAVTQIGEATQQNATLVDETA
jgi:methyl-accepting chemotaxis protein